MAVRIQLRGDTAANWTSVNPILAEREMALETDTMKFKIGNGTSYWTGLTYASFTGVSQVMAGTNTYVGGTVGNPTVNVSALTINTITASGSSSFQTVSATTYFSGSTNLYGVFAPKTVSMPYDFAIAASDETTALTTGNAKTTFISPCAWTVTGVTASLTTTGSSLSTINVKKNGTTIFSTKVTIDSGEYDSSTAATPAVITGGTWSKYDKITVDIDGAGTAATGLKLLFDGNRTVTF